MTPVERVARAIYERRANTLAFKDWDGLDERVRGFLMDDARAALAAMREPSEGMVWAGWDVMSYDADRLEVSGVFRAMIDKALEEV